MSFNDVSAKRVQNLITAEISLNPLIQHLRARNDPRQPRAGVGARADEVQPLHVLALIVRTKPCALGQGRLKLKRAALRL